MTDGVETRFGTDTRGRVASAIYNAAVDSARNQVESFDFQLSRITSVFNVAVSESDRSVSILLFALAEDLMLHALRHNMDGDCSGGWDSVTSGNGVLATASDRIMILELLKWIRPITGSQIRLMKSIRNRFAHHSDVCGFEDQKIRGWVSTMHAGETSAFELFPADERAKWRKHTPREIFIMRATGVITGLVADLAIMPASRRERVSAWDVSGRGDFDNLPEPLKDLNCMTADVYLKYLPPRDL